MYFINRHYFIFLNMNSEQSSAGCDGKLEEQSETDYVAIYFCRTLNDDNEEDGELESTAHAVKVFF